jgi:hypothetical protein
MRMKIYTFTKITQWSYGFYQVVDETELEALKQLDDSEYGRMQYRTESEFSHCDFDDSPRVVFSIEYDNDAYEG